MPPARIAGRLDFSDAQHFQHAFPAPLLQRQSEHLQRLAPCTRPARRGSAAEAGGGGGLRRDPGNLPIPAAADPPFGWIVNMAVGIL